MRALSFRAALSPISRASSFVKRVRRLPNSFPVDHGTIGCDAKAHTPEHSSPVSSINKKRARGLSGRSARMVTSRHEHPGKAGDHLGNVGLHYDNRQTNGEFDRTLPPMATENVLCI